MQVTSPPLQVTFPYTGYIAVTLSLYRYMALYSLHPTLARISFLTNIKLGTDRAEYPGHSGTDFS